jgi:hypothetical protein
MKASVTVLSSQRSVEPNQLRLIVMHFVVLNLEMQK